jgi:hypothetical protein
LTEIHRRTSYPETFVIAVPNEKPAVAGFSARAARNELEQLEPTTYAAVSLAELYAQAGRWDDFIELTGGGVQNEDDAGAAKPLVKRAQAGLTPCPP